MILSHPPEHCRVDMKSLDRSERRLRYGLGSTGIHLRRFSNGRNNSGIRELKQLRLDRLRWSRILGQPVGDFKVYSSLIALHGRDQFREAVGEIIKKRSERKAASGYVKRRSEPRIDAGMKERFCQAVESDLIALRRKNFARFRSDSQSSRLGGMSGLESPLRSAPQFPSGQQLLNDLSANVGQPEVSALVTIRELLVIETQAVQQRRL